MALKLLILLFTVSLAVGRRQNNRYSEDKGQTHQDLNNIFGQQESFPDFNKIDTKPETGQQYEEFNFGQTHQEPYLPHDGQNFEAISPARDNQQQKLLNEFEKIHFGKEKPQITTEELPEEVGQQFVDDSFLLQDDGQQQIIFPNVPEKGPLFRGGCNSKPPTPMNAVMKCSLFNGCKATCQKGHEFPNGELILFITCKNGDWKIGGDSWQVVPPCRPICLPGCQNNGICIGPNQCQCPKNFGGPQCQFEKKPCYNYPPLPANSVRSCTSKSCTVTCAKGFVFPDGSSITNLVCKEGQWKLSRTDWVSLPDCQAVCDPPCVNGGSCLALNVCQCPQRFTGPQCQYEMSACSGEKLHFNGIHNCSGNGERLVCELRCPPGIGSTTPFVKDYTCLYATGKFEPQPIPSCVYGDNAVVVPLNTSSNTYYSAMQVVRGSYHNKNQPGTKTGKQVSWDIVNLFESDFNKPAPGECYTWGGTHIKNFDGGMYSFDSPCSFVLSKDQMDGTFEIIIESYNCSLKNCERSLLILYQNSEYRMNVKDEIRELYVDGKKMNLPSQLPGFTVEVTPSFSQIRLHSLDISVTWNGKDFISVGLNENMWNRTAGLCGNMNKASSDDFMTKSGTAARSLEAFLDSWTVGDGDKACSKTPIVSSPCVGAELTNVAKRCELMLNDPHWAACREAVNVKPFYDACLWDSCKCEECSCGTLAAFAKECKNDLDQPVPNWRSITNCSLKCAEPKLYSSCAPVQPTCNKIQAALDPPKISECVEGCYCPEGTVLDQDTCIPTEMCPCQLRGKMFPSGSTIPKGCNSCTCESGSWICTEVRCGARCSSVGDPHYVTFDGRRFDFMGQCSYYLVKSENYSIEAENVPCSGAISRSMHLAPGPDIPTCTKAVTIKIGARFIRLKQNGEVFVNGDEIINFPYQDEGFSLRSISSLFMLVALDNGIDVWWDGITSVYVDVPANLYGETKGLCGTFNLNQKDDFFTPEGDVEQAVVPFANKWKIDEKCNEVVDKQHEHPCDRDPVRRENAIKLCSKLKSPIFSSCHWHVDVEAFYQNCLYDACSCATNIKSCFCPLLADYASECAREGVPLIWRTEVRECGLHCPGGQTYQACGDSCSRSCQDITLFPNCRRRCVEGCNCPEGQTLNLLGVCIPVAQCPCNHHNRPHAAGTQLVMEHYQGPKFCTCTNALWDCRPATDVEITKHSEIEEIKSSCSPRKHQEFTICEPAEPVTCKNMHRAVEFSPAKCIPGCVCKKGFVWDSILKICIPPNECPCHHGGESYDNGRTIQQDCNTCTCSAGKWNCTDRACAAICSTWGDSHFKTFDGKIFDFQGSCDFLLTGGALSDSDVFDIKIQIIPCGTSGISCPKSVTLKVGRTEIEEIVLTKGRPLPVVDSLQRITIREAGIFIFVEVFDLGIVLKWDRGTRIYVKADPKWRNKVKGLCGNMNNDEQDDLNSPSGGISEVSPVLFADSWRMHPYCPDSSVISNPCEHNPQRRSWAIAKCGILKSPVFAACHSEVVLDSFLDRCILDTCGCDEGGDCECLCSAVAAYAQECAFRGISIKWRSQEMCPLQCDQPGASYSPCVSPCPKLTCDNRHTYKTLLGVCLQETCVEGCQTNTCPENQIFSNKTFKQCVDPSTCKTACLTIGNLTYFEGDLMESDDCHSCFCSHNKKICSGVPCTTFAPTTTESTPLPTIANDHLPQCVSGWTKWINLDHPIQLKKKTDYEELPTENLLILMQSIAHCNSTQMADIRCRDSKTLAHYKETGFDVECSLERGLRCVSTNIPCPDFEMSVLCQCEGAVTTTTTTAAPAPACPHDEKWVDCAIPCNKSCHYFGHYLVSRGLCTLPTQCLPGCVPKSWEPCPNDEWLRDGQTCVKKKDCTCRSDAGDSLKPGSIFHESECGKCQCVLNQYECDFSDCFVKPTKPPSTTPSTRQDRNLFNVTLPGIYRHDFGNVTVFYLTTPSTITPPPPCPENRYHSLMKNNNAVVLDSSSYRDTNTKPDAGKLDNPNSSWTAKRENLDQYLEVDLGNHYPIYGVVVTGDRVGHFVTSFRLLYSTDGVSYRYISTPDNINEVFRGPVDGSVPVKQILPMPFEARYIRFNPITWHGAISMRVDILGCGGEMETTTEPIHIVTSPKPICDSPMGIDRGEIVVHVSSAKYGHGVEGIRLSSESSWKPLTSSQFEFVLIDLLEPRNVTGIITKGEALANDIESIMPESWVESFKLMYSIDKTTWNPIIDSSGNEKLFLGNFDGDSLRKNYFEQAVRARYVKLYPIKWRHEVALRLELIGCYEPYPTTTILPPTVPNLPCLCPGVEPVDKCPCGDSHWWDGEYCVERWECPCFVGHMSYSVGSVFHKENCEECVCRMNGVENCSPKQCPPCPYGLRSSLTPSCGCICKSCEPGTLLCHTSGACIPEPAWCDGVRDCPDDETNCPTPATVHETKKDCNVTCPPDYAIVFTEQNEVEIMEPSRFSYKAAKKHVKSSKSAKGRKSVKRPVDSECPPFECVPMPTIPPTKCPQPACPLNFTVERKETQEVASTACPRFVCKPLPETASCLLTGRTFVTFDAVVYKFDVCDHILAADLDYDDWNISVFKKCKSFAPCGISVVVNHEGRNLVFWNESFIQVDGFDYAAEQVHLINAQTTAFNVTKIGDSWLFISNIHNFKLNFDNRGDVQVEVDSSLKNHINGLCGFYNGNPEDDKKQPDGTISHSTIDFGHSWMTPSAERCDTKVCSVDIQQRALQLCYTITKAPFSDCASVIDAHQFLPQCLETTCICLQGNKTEDECRCEALLNFVTTCRNNEPRIELAGWRLEHNCPASCPPGMIHYDCYPFSCEASCEEASCFSPATSCFSGCFCPFGMLRRGDSCIKPTDCLDCECNGFGDSQYLTFDRSNFTFGGNCTYVAARNVPESGVPDFQVVVSHKPCHAHGKSQCPQKISIYTRSHLIDLIALNDHMGLVNVDGNEVSQLPLNLTYAFLEQTADTSLHVFLPKYFVHVFYKYPTFSIKLPSNFYKNQTEGLCGNCNKNSSDEAKASSELSDLWLVKHLSEDCVAPKIECLYPDYEPSRCNFIQNADIFGKCHALIDPGFYVNLCLTNLCHNGSICESGAAYAKACREVGVCVDWRTSSFCPFDCPRGLVYNSCDIGCTKNCENYEEIDKNCELSNVEGCFCPNNQISVNGSCVNSTWCEICDDEGHRSGETWNVDKCTKCTCVGRTKSCTHQNCVVENICPEGFYSIHDKSKNEECCPQFLCLPNPTEPTIVCPEPIKPECGYGQILQTNFDSNGCPHLTCRCKPREECDEQQTQEAEILPIGMERFTNNSGCCPRLEIICNPSTCPIAPKCPEYFELTTRHEDCCPIYNCEKPRNVCLYEMNHPDGKIMTARKPGTEWQDGPCKVCTCKLYNNETESVCSTRECLSIESHVDFTEYDLAAVPGADTCCPDIKRIACRVNDKIFKVGSSWFPEPNDKCSSLHCVKNEFGLIVKEVRLEKCTTDCEFGWEYRPSNETCCGQCVQSGCVINGKLYKNGDNWPGIDNCTTFSCLGVLGGFLVTSEAEKCPNLENCPVENIYQDGCCPRCKLIAPALINCAPTEITSNETIGIIEDFEPFHGKCTNLDPIPKFTECSGACDSHTTFNQRSWMHDKICHCCQPTAFTGISVDLICQDKYIKKQKIEVPSKCACQSCGH